MYKCIFIVCIFFSVQFIYAQTEGSAFNQTGRGGTATTFVTDYQSIGINPANLGFSTKHAVALGIAEFGISAYSEALVKEDVHNILFNHSDSINDAQQEILSDAFLNEGMTVNVNARAVGLSIKFSDHAAIALSFDGSASYHSKLGENASQLIFQGYDFVDYFDTIVITPFDTFAVAFEPLSLSELMEGTEFKFQVRSDINLAFGTKIFGNDKLNIYTGIGLKYILGFSYLDIKVDENKITGVSALGLGILDLNINDTPSEILNDSYKPVGTGFGFDIGVSATLGEKITVGLSVIDIGKMTYTANVLEINDVTVDTVYFSGVTTTDPIQMIEQLLANENIIAYSGLTEFTVSLPTTLRMGAGLKATDYLNLGADIILPMNDVAGAYESATLGIGAEVRLAEIIKLSSGISYGGGYDFNIAGGFGLDFKIWELGIATRDILTLFGEERPTVSMAIGVLRFKI